MVTTTEKSILRCGGPTKETKKLFVKAAVFGVYAGLSQPELLVLPLVLLTLSPLLMLYVMGCAYHQASHYVQKRKMEKVLRAIDALAQERFKNNTETPIEQSNDDPGYDSGSGSDGDDCDEWEEVHKYIKGFKNWHEYFYGRTPNRVFTHPEFNFYLGLAQCVHRRIFEEGETWLEDFDMWYWRNYGINAFHLTREEMWEVPAYLEYQKYAGEDHYEEYMRDDGYEIPELQSAEDVVDVVHAGAKSFERSLWNLKLIAAFALTSKFLTSRSKFVKFSSIIGLWQLYTSEPPSTQIETFVEQNLNLLACAVAYCHNLIEKCMQKEVREEIEMQSIEDQQQEVPTEDQVVEEEPAWKREFEALWPEGASVEGLEKHRGLLSIAALAIGFLSVTLAPGVLWMTSEKTTFGNALIELGKTISAKNIVWTEVKKVKDNIMWIIWKCCGKSYIPDEDREAQVVQNALMTHMKDLAAYEKLLASDFFGAMRSNKLEVISKGIEKTEQLLGQLSGIKKSQYNLTTILANIKTGYEDLLDKRLNLITNAIGKQEPVVIHLCGPPGHGKSEFMKNFLVKQLEEQYGISAYFRNAHDEYWSRFAGQQILVWDDIGFKKDGADYAEFCYHTSGAPSSAIGAAIKEKGRPTNPLFIIVTSNEMYLGTQGHELTTPDAFHRRRDVVIHFYNERAAQYQLEKGETIPPHLYDETATKLTVYRPVPNKGEPSRNALGLTTEERLWNFIVEKEKLCANHFKRMLRTKGYYHGAIPQDSIVDESKTVLEYLVAPECVERQPVQRPKSREDLTKDVYNAIKDAVGTAGADDLIQIVREFEGRTTFDQAETERIWGAAAAHSVPIQEIQDQIQEQIEEQAINPEQKSISQKKPCILISGPSGVGKTHMASVFCQRISQHPMVRVQATDLCRETDYREKVLFVDDITMSKEDYLKAIKYANFFYEMNLPNPPLAVIFTQNEQKLKHVADDSMITEIRRRSHCVDVSYHWTWRQLFWSHTQLAVAYKENIRKAEPKAKCMNENLCAFFTAYEGKRVQAQASEITSLLFSVYEKVYGDEIQTTKLWTLPLPSEIDFSVNLKRTIRECARISFKEVFGSIFSGKLYSINNISNRFSVGTAMSMVVDIFQQAPYGERQDLDDFVISFNEAEVCSAFRPPGTAIITTPEGHVGLAWQEKSIRMFKITDDPVELAENKIDIHRYFNPNVDSIYKKLVSRLTFTKEGIENQQKIIDDIQSDRFVKTSFVCKILQSVLSVCMIAITTAAPIMLVKDMMSEMEDRNELTYLRKVHEKAVNHRNAGFTTPPRPKFIFTESGSVPIADIEELLSQITITKEQKKRICLDNPDAARFFAHQRTGGEYPILWKLFKEHMYIPITPSLESISVQRQQYPIGVYGDQQRGEVNKRIPNVQEEYSREDEDQDDWDLGEERDYMPRVAYHEEKARQEEEREMEYVRKAAKRFHLDEDYLKNRLVRWEDESAPEPKKKFQVQKKKPNVESSPKIEKKQPGRKIEVFKKARVESAPQPRKIFKRKVVTEGRVDITPDHFSLDEAVTKAREYEGDVYLFGNPHGFAATTGRDPAVSARITREYAEKGLEWAVVIISPEKANVVVPQLETEIEVEEGQILRIRRTMANHEYWHYGIVGPSPVYGSGKHLYHVQSTRDQDGNITAHIAVDPIHELERGWEAYDNPIYTPSGQMYVPAESYEFLRDHAYTKFPYNVNTSNCETWALAMRYGIDVLTDAKVQQLPSYFVALLEIASTFTDMKDKFQEIRQATEKIQEEACADPSALSVAREAMPPNAVFIHSAKSGALLSRGLGVRGRIVLMNHHTKGQEFLVVRYLNGTKYEAFATRAWDDPALDLSLLRIDDVQFPMFKDIANKFMTISDMRIALGLGTDSVAMLNVPMTGKFGFYMHCSTLRVKGQLNNEFTGDTLLAGVGLQYSTKMIGGEGGLAVTEKGDCGSAVVLFNNRINKKIVGIHRAGSETKMYVALVPQEKLMIALGEVERHEESFEDADCIVAKQCVVTDEATGFPLVGFSKFANAVARGTRLRLSPIEIPSAPCDGEPAILGPRDPRANGYEPALTTLSNFPLDPVVVDRKELRTVSDEIVNHLAQMLRPLGVLTRTEAINGPSRHRYPMAGSLDRKTSPGFPHVFRDRTTTKQSYFKQMQEKDGSELWRVDLNSENGKKLDADLARMLRQAHQGIRPNVVFSYFPKDEVLAKRKITTPKTRGILASNVPYVIAYRQYFLALHLRVQELFDRLPIKIGIDPHVNWNDLAQYHLAKGNLGFDADAKNWDASVPVEFMEECAYIANRLYKELDPDWKPEHDVVRSALHACVERPYILYNRKVIQTHGGQVSGQPGTAFDNSLINWLLVAIIYIRVMKKAGQYRKATFTHFMKDCALSVYGDDMIITMGADSAPYFTIDKYAEEAKKFGFTITTADKDSEITSRQSRLEEMTFLKRSFKKIERTWVGPIEFASIGKSLKWIKGSGSYYPQRTSLGIVWKVSDDLEVIKDNFVSQLVEASLHGEMTYNAIRQDMNRGLREHNMDPITMSFNGALAQAGALLIEGRTTHGQSRDLSREPGQNQFC